MPAQVQLLLPSLLQLLQCSYAATLCPSDRAVLRLMMAVDKLLRPTSAKPKRSGSSDSDDEEDDESDPAADDETHIDGEDEESDVGPLAASGFCWGPVASQLFSLEAGSSSSELTRQRRSELQRAQPMLDARRCALTCIFFPDARTQLLSEESPFSAEASAAATASSGSTSGLLDLEYEQSDLESSSGQWIQCGEAGYDLAYVLPFIVAVMGEGSMGVEAALSCGVLPLCLRCMALADDTLR